MRVVYLGSGDIGIPSLRWLLCARRTESVQPSPVPR
jgi:hypothetical protein